MSIGISVNVHFDANEVHAGAQPFLIDIHGDGYPNVGLFPRDLAAVEALRDVCNEIINARVGGAA